MVYRVEYTKAALKQLKKMDRFDARLIVSWIGKNLFTTIFILFIKF